MDILTVVCLVLAFVFVFSFTCFCIQKKEKKIPHETISSLLYLEQKNAIALNSSNGFQIPNRPSPDKKSEPKEFPSVPNHDPVNSKHNRETIQRSLNTQMFIHSGSGY